MCAPSLPFATYFWRSCGYVPVFWVVRFVFDRCMFRVIAGSALASKGTNAHCLLVQQRQLNKLTESLWKASIYVALHLYAWRVLWSKSWLWDTSEFWRLDGLDVDQQLQYEDMQHLYTVQTGFYLSSVFMLMVWETRRNDFPVMMTHHFVTLGLLMGSFATGYTRVGSVILLLHDFSDIWLEVAKVFNYVGCETLSAICFLAMATSWAALRLYAFPAYIIRSCMFEAQEVTGYPVDYWYPFNALLCVLVVMHVYWFALILKVAVMVVKGSAKDVRED